jgi:hypothetical protein
MNNPPPLNPAFSPDLSDEAAYEIAEFLEALNFAFDEHYYGQIRRHRRAIHPRRSDLVDPPGEEGPF